MKDRMPNDHEVFMFVQWMEYCLSRRMTPTDMLLDKPHHLYQYLWDKCRQEGIPYIRAGGRESGYFSKHK